jgi:hypothetical protein
LGHPNIKMATGVGGLMLPQLLPMLAVPAAP